MLGKLIHLARPSRPSVRKESLNDLLSQAVELLAFERKAKDIKIVEQYDPELPEIEIDQEAMLQAFLNILLNAVQAMENGGKIEVATVLLTPRLIQVEIRNTGSSIPKMARRRVFDPYFTTKENGTGLGLAITYQVVASHGGTIDVQSNDFETKFIIELPVKSEL